MTLDKLIDRLRAVREANASVGELEVDIYIHGILRPITDVRLYTVPQAFSEAAREETPRKLVVIR